MGEIREDDTASAFLDELTKLLKTGFHRRPRSLSLPLLGAAAQIEAGATEPPTDDRIQDVLARGTEALSLVPREALTVLLDFGIKPLNPGSRRDRRRAAMSKIDASLTSVEYFGKYLEKPLLQELADALAAEYPTLARSPFPPADDQARVASPQPLAVSVSATRSGVRPPVFVAAVVLVLVATAIWGLKALQSGEHALGHLGVPFLSDPCGRIGGKLPEASSEAAFYAYVPHEVSRDASHGWTSTLLDLLSTEHLETLHTNEPRSFAITYQNETTAIQRDVEAKAALPEGARFADDSTCLYREKADSGVRYKGAPLGSPHGLAIPNVRPHESIFVTFTARLPPTIPCSGTYIEILADMREGLASETGWTRNGKELRVSWERHC